MSIDLDLTTLVAGISLTAIGGWIGSFLSLRKDERAVQIEQVTKERTKWRENMRKLCKDIVLTYHSNMQAPAPEKISANRSKLVTSLNPKDDLDTEILTHYDSLCAGSAGDIDAFTKRIALLLKHDWERVKWECTPVYLKPLLRYTKRQREWRRSEYRKI